LDAAIKASSKFKNFSAVKKQFLADMKAADNWHTFLVQKCGIVLDNKDTGAISGSDAGGSKVITSDNIFDSVEGALEYPEGDSFTVDGLTIYGIPDRDTLTEQQQLVVKGLYNLWLKNALDLIKNSFGLTYNEEGTQNHRLGLVFIDNEKTGIRAGVDSQSTDGDKKTLGGTKLIINMAHLKDLSEDNLIADDIHRTLAHELVHGLMSINFDYCSELPGWFTEGAAELIHGIDDARNGEFSMMFQDPNVLESILQLEYSADNVPYPAYTGGYIFLRYFAHQAAGAPTVAGEDGYMNNYSDGETLQVSADVSTVENAGDYVRIALADRGEVINYGTGASIVGSDSVDSIYNYEGFASIDGGAGNDIVTGIYSNNSTLNGGAGDDSIRNYGALSVVDGGAGNDTINNNVGSRNYFTAVANEGGSPEFIETSSIVSGAYSTVDGGAGDDLIYNHADNALIFGGAGNDTLQNEVASFRTYVDDNIKATMYACVDPTLDGGAGNDVLINTLASAWLYGGDGEDSIRNSGDEVLIEGGEGDDSITNIGDEISIGGGTGDDLIRNAGKNTMIEGGVGEDTIINEGRLVSINAGVGNDLIRSSGDHATLVGGAGADTFVVTDGVGVFIYDYNPDEDFISIASGVSGVTTLNNTVETENDFITVDGTYNNFESDTMIVGGSNADSIINNALYVAIYGGGDDDSIRNEGAFCWIDLGAGNDFIRSSGDFSTITGGAGNDTFVIADGTSVVITDFNADEDIISLASGASSIINDEGMIEITVANPVEPVDSTEYTPQVGAIKRLMASLDQTTLSGTDALDEAINAASNGSVESYADFVNRFRADLISCGGNGQRFLLEYCGINLFNEDTGAITGADAGGTLKSETDLIDVSGAASYPSSDTFTIDGLTLYGLPDRSSLTADQQMIVRDLYSWWLDGSLELINQSYGLTLNEEGTTNHRMRLNFYDVDQLWKAAVEYMEGDEPVIIANLKINMHFFEDIDADDRHGINDTVNLDQVLLHELTHAAMVANIDNFNALPLWFAEGSAELVRGIDTSGNRRPLIIQYANDGNALIDMLNGDASDDVYVSYAGGYIAMRYMAKQFSGQTFDYDEYRPTIKGNDQLNYFDDVKMIGTSKADTIVNVGDEVSINAKGGDDYIISTGDDVTIKTGGGNDTISIESGSAWIKDYSARKDTLLLGDGASTVKSHGGILVTFDATADQLSALIDVEPTVDELSEIMTPTAIEVGPEESTTEKIFGADPSLTMLNVAKRHRDRTK
ncbi:MAG: calcium-binding protein, partial [Selenomonadaceae bacterium]|nr:calcium-binding protein [Selenomonadaceae bacterium]